MPDPGPAGPAPCAVRSLGFDEPMVGTASRVRAWLLVEQPGPWGPDALTGSRLDPGLGAALARAGHEAGVRVLLVRRPGRTPNDGRPRACFLAHTGVRARWVERLALTDPAELLGLDLEALRRPQPPGIGTPVTDPLLLVCTNGRHDRCCADRGRPLAAALAASHHADLVWESSHIGGDRFAGNLVCLPDGLYFGRVGPDEAVKVADAYLAGEIDLAHYRGRSCYDMLTQAAEDAIRRRWDLTGVGDLALVRRDHRRDGLGRAEVDTRWTGPDGTWRARVRAVPAHPPRTLTCQSTRALRPPVYQVLDLDHSPA